MNFVTQWEGLPDAVERVSTTAGISKTEAQTSLARAIAEGGINFRAKLGKLVNNGMTHSRGIAERFDFQISTALKSEDFDWDNSRPLKPWYVKRGNADLPHGDWTLEWIELAKSDVTTILCPDPDKSLPPTTGKNVAKPKSGRALESARREIKMQFPAGVPDQADLPNKALCAQVQAKLNQKVSDDTILRAAGRRK